MDLHYFRPLEAHPLPSRLEKKSGKAVWNPSKLGMRSLWECHVPPKVPRLCWKQNHDLPELQKTEGERDWSIIPAGWNHWESKADAWLKSWRYIIYIVYIYIIYIYISSAPRVFSRRNGGLLTVHRDLALWRLDFFPKLTHSFNPQTGPPTCCFQYFFWGLGLGVSRKNPSSTTKKNRLKHMKRSALLGVHDAFQMWGIHRNWARWTSDPTWPLEALKGRGPGDEEPGTWKIHIYIYVYIYFLLYTYIPEV